MVDQLKEGDGLHIPPLTGVDAGVGAQIDVLNGKFMGSPFSGDGADVLFRLPECFKAPPGVIPFGTGVGGVITVVESGAPLNIQIDRPSAAHFPDAGQVSSGEFQSFFAADDVTSAAPPDAAFEFAAVDGLEYFIKGKLFTVGVNISVVVVNREDVIF